MVTGSLEIPATLTHIVHIAALLHDVGRFPQYNDYRTYNDRESVNHAQLGVQVLRGADILDNLSSEHRRLVLATVFLHNRATPLSGLASNLSLMVQIIQDADKLDIIPTVIANLSPGAPAKRVVSLGLSANGDRYSQAVYKRIAMHRPVDMSEMVWLNDFKLMLLGWLPALNFSVSRKVVLKRRYVEDLIASLPPHPELIALGERVRSDLLSSC